MLQIALDNRQISAVHALLDRVYIPTSPHSYIHAYVYVYHYRVRYCHRKWSQTSCYRPRAIWVRRMTGNACIDSLRKALIHRYHSMYDVACPSHHPFAVCMRQYGCIYIVRRSDREIMADIGCMVARGAQRSRQTYTTRDIAILGRIGQTYGPHGLVIGTWRHYGSIAAVPTV